MYPSLSEIIKLHQKYAPSEELFDRVVTHSQIVWEIAQTIIKKKQLDIRQELVHKAALLHDIGSYKFLAMKKEDGEAQYYKHALEGAHILRFEGIAEEICLIVEHHLGVGLPKEEIIAQQMDLPHKDILPTTIEERLVLYADKFHSKTPKFNTYESYLEYTKRFKSNAPQRFIALKEEFGVPDLTPFSEKYHFPIL